VAVGTAGPTPQSGFRRIDRLCPPYGVAPQWSIWEPDRSELK
jgi:hypothetical protein